MTIRNAPSHLKALIALACLLVVVLASCAPATQAEESHVLLMPAETGTTWSATIDGVAVELEYVAEIILNGQPAPNNAGISVSSHFQDNQFGGCKIQIAPRWVAAERLGTAGTSAAAKYEAQTASLARMLATCFHASLGEDAPEDSVAYVDGWAELYLERCGPIMQPLGMPVTDGTCEVPSRREALAS